MPVQSLRSATPASTRRGSVGAGAACVCAGSSMIGGAIAAHRLGGARDVPGALSVAGLTLAGKRSLGADSSLVALFAWIALSFATRARRRFCCCAAVSALGIDRYAPLPTLDDPHRAADSRPTTRTRERLLGGLQAIYESLPPPAQLEQFDFFILSDTTDPDIVDRRGSGLPRAARAHRRARPDLLSPPPRQHASARPATSPNG